MGDKDHKYYKRRKKRYEDDDDQDENEDDLKSKYIENHKGHKLKTIERILTPGATANNLLKIIATGTIGIITVLLMIIFAVTADVLNDQSFLTLALMALAANTISTACVWMFGNNKKEELDNEENTKLLKELRTLNLNVDELKIQKNKLEERLSNVEILESFEEKLAKRTLEKKDLHIKTSNSKNTPLISKLPTNSNEQSETHQTQSREKN